MFEYLRITDIFEPMTDIVGRKRRSTQIPDKRVALAIVDKEYAHGRLKIKGIIDYYRKHLAWEILRNAELQPMVMPEDLMKWSGDGVISEIYTEADASVFNSLSMPVVNTSVSPFVEHYPSVRVDNHAIGHMAAEHLMECKVDRFAFVGPEKLFHARERQEGFAQTLEKSGRQCTSIWYPPRKVDETRASEELVSPDVLMDALSGLTLPVGIMVSSDKVGFAVLEACSKLGLRSPEDVAVIGVDNDEYYCNLAYSSMTSISPNSRKVGFRAARMLDQLMRGEELKQTCVLIPPSRIVFRNSTDMSRSQYPEVALALRFIRNHANEFIDVSNVLDVVPVSRRWLEIKFREEVGCGIYQEIRRLHVERAKQLLVSTDWPLSRIAKESGFNKTDRFELAFHKLLGMSAAEYRRQQLNP